MTTILGKVFNGALYFDSATAFMQALVPFEGKRVEVTVREMPMTATEPRADARLCKCGHRGDEHWHPKTSPTYRCGGGRLGQGACPCTAYEPAAAPTVQFCACIPGEMCDWHATCFHHEPKAEPAGAEPVNLRRRTEGESRAYMQGHRSGEESMRERAAKAARVFGQTLLSDSILALPTVQEAPSPEPVSGSVLAGVGIHSMGHRIAPDPSPPPAEEAVEPPVGFNAYRDEEREALLACREALEHVWECPMRERRCELDMRCGGCIAAIQALARADAVVKEKTDAPK